MHKQKAELFSSNRTDFSHAIDNEALFRMGGGLLKMTSLLILFKMINLAFVDNQNIVKKKNKKMTMPNNMFTMRVFV